jgi:hypothetical protein
MRRAVHVIFALVLFIASSLKAHALLWPVELPGALPAWVQWFAIAVEWVVGSWLLSGIGAKWAHRAGMALLGIFIVVAGSRLFIGANDCGCFGAVHVHPAWTLSFDVIAFMAFWYAGNGNVDRATAIGAAPRRSNYLPGRITAATAISLALPALLLLSGAHQQPRIILIDHPNLLVGKPFPLLSAVDDVARQDLTHGPRTVILFSHDCDHCREYLDRLASSARSPADRKEIRIIDILNDSPDDRTRRGWPFRQVVLPGNVRCLAPVPLRLELQDGIVKSIEHESEK